MSQLEIIQKRAEMIVGTQVTTPLGAGRVMNHVLRDGALTTYLILLDAEVDSPREYGDRATWRAFKPDEVTEAT